MWPANSSVCVSVPVCQVYNADDFSDDPVY